MIIKMMVSPLNISRDNNLLFDFSILIKLNDYSKCNKNEISETSKFLYAKEINFSFGGMHYFFVFFVTKKVIKSLKKSLDFIK